MPTDCVDNLPEFTQCLAIISAAIESVDTECTVILGDFNAHPRSLFGKELADYCGEQSLCYLDVERLDKDTYEIRLILVRSLSSCHPL
ncbi:unnamed protein product [Leptidea sinapis]|uniref:Endonuclease/exonuclease/phosphatase domain-containing protein n=1 Tax=Leptidea sinapis TaxID=189913 RepID=A0A5E4PT18_9NEOP|nr:unnamed protein product [Leptidea sinapis]